jgi:hypothetical protein
MNLSREKKRSGWLLETIEIIEQNNLEDIVDFLGEMDASVWIKPESDEEHIMQIFEKNWGAAHPGERIFITEHKGMCKEKQFPGLRFLVFEGVRA